MSVPNCKPKSLFGQIESRNLSATPSLAKSCRNIYNTRQILRIWFSLLLANYLFFWFYRRVGFEEKIKYSKKRCYVNHGMRDVAGFTFEYVTNKQANKILWLLCLLCKFISPEATAILINFNHSYGYRPNWTPLSPLYCVILVSFSYHSCMFRANWVHGLRQLHHHRFQAMVQCNSTVCLSSDVSTVIN